MIRRMEERDLPLIAELEKLPFMNLESTAGMISFMYLSRRKLFSATAICGCWPVMGRCSALPCIRPAAAWDWAEK